MKKFLTVFFTFTLYFNLFTQANAAPVGGWTMSNPVAQGASTLYNASKNVMINGKNVVKTSTALIAPTATGVAKVLAKGVAGVALSVAVEQLLGAVDWVLDPANNRIKYTLPNQCSTPSDCPASQYLYKKGSVVYSNQADACNAAIKGSGLEKSYTAVEWPKSSQPKSLCLYFNKSTRSETTLNGISVTVITNRAYDPNADAEEKYLPLPVVAEKVISNAAAGDVNAQAATTAAAADMVKDAESDNVKARPIVNQLDANAKTETDADANTATGSQTQNPTKPETTDLKLEFPAFCGWAPIVCEAAQVAIAFPRLVTGWWETIVEKTNSWATSISESWTAVKEWAKSEESKDTELEIPDPIQPPIDTDISFGGICPADHEAQINMGVGVIKMPISYEPICTTVSTAKPVLIFVGFFIAALIIGGVKTE
ncbi:MAG: putative assembly protein [Inoviridae sp.]|nr:MAG: putative assembly protein [Inoviridae sp.]